MKEKKSRIKIESEKGERNWRNANKSSENHGINDLKVDFCHLARTFIP